MNTQSTNTSSTFQASYSLNSPDEFGLNASLNQPKLPIRIAKFGGTSVADFDAMSLCAHLILSDSKTKLVVLSASAGVTNHLVKLAKGTEGSDREETLKTISDIQAKILSKLPESHRPIAQIDAYLARIEVLAQACFEASCDANSDNNQQLALADEMVAHGELLSTTLFTSVMQSLGAPAKFVDVRSILKTDSRYGRAMPDINAIRIAAQTHLKESLGHHIIITQGFIGSDGDGNTTTLGRGGSDYSAALLAEGLNASEVAIWTDVPGIYTTDPRIAPLARPIANISFVEAAEMATFGAKILHPATLLPAVRANIPVFIGSSKAPEAGGTYVNQVADPSPLFRALTLRREQTLLTLHSLQMLHARGFLAEIFAILAKHQISVDLITTSEISVSLTLDTTGSNTTGDSLITPALIQELSALCRVEVETDLTLVAIIGNNLTQTAGVGQDVFDVLSPYPIRLICFGASSHNFCVLVPSDNADAIVRDLHKRLFEG
ncbi:lysine-sensitive aspartokinase 3 [Thorsellia anophelis]|uniref:Aspartokinase n=1 Tax=Thorsellia anophelis DSM 18579 TaxID=1123402 RepID=A0A1I0BDB7_9GAMM|nr:lysine-sensitive aspartokinase 3 [Thorsellia anophelis]SET04148.1 aspartate kinase [Thorsellia anophelis DSM 18579]